MKPMNRARHLGITAVAIFAIIVGIGEMIVGFTGNFLGILSTPLMPPSSTIIIGLCYILGGLSFLTMRKRGAGRPYPAPEPLHCPRFFISSPARSFCR